MVASSYTLEQAEADLRNVYWRIRCSRKTNWKALNEARSICAAMEKMGVTRWEIKAARYCLRTRDCRRCNHNAGPPNVACFRIGERRQLGLPVKIS
jgi:hypothetical protein